MIKIIEDLDSRITYIGHGIEGVNVSFGNNYGGI